MYYVLCTDRVRVCEIADDPHIAGRVESLVSLGVDVKTEHAGSLRKKLLGNGLADPTGSSTDADYLAVKCLGSWTLSELGLLELPVLHVKQVLLGQTLVARALARPLNPSCRVPASSVDNIQDSGASDVASLGFRAQGNLQDSESKPVPHFRHPALHGYRSANTDDRTKRQFRV